MARNFLTLEDLSASEFRDLIARAGALARQRAAGVAHQPLVGRVLGMIFEKASTRTRVSFEAGMVQLGGGAVFLDTQHSQLGRGEPIEDTLRVIASMVDAVVMRTFDQKTLEGFARLSPVPVINGLTDDYHPCQLLADMQTYFEAQGDIAGKTVAWIGDGNNMCQSYIQAAKLLDFELRIACPPGFEPDPGLLATAGDRATLVPDPAAATLGAHLVSTDIWVSMGQEVERERRLQAFAPYQVGVHSLEHADPEVIFLHCLPAHRGEEVTAALLEDPRSQVWQQAENRLHSQKALLELLLVGEE